MSKREKASSERGDESVLRQPSNRLAASFAFPPNFEHIPTKMAISRLAIVKFLELALTCICIGIHYHSYECVSSILNILGGQEFIHRSMLVTGTFVGYLIILIGGTAGFLLQTPIHKRIDIFFSLVGCALFIASGALIIEAWHDAGKSDLKDKNLAKASMAIINGAVFFLDCILRFRGE